MTTGTILTDRTSTIRNGKVGLYFYKNWSGGDRSASSRPVKPVFVPPFNEYASSLNLNKFAKHDRIPILMETYRRWRSARDSFFLQLKAYHIAKADWIKKSRSEMHPYDMTLVSINHGSGNVRHIPSDWTDENVSLSGTFGWNNPSIPWTSNDDIALVNKIQSKLDGGVGFHLGLALAESERTFSMITSNAKRFRRIGESLSSGNFAKAFRVAMNGSSAHHIKGFSGLKGIADNYLLFQFGIKPLVDDVIDAARHYGYAAGRPKQVRIAVGRRAEAESNGPSHGAWTQWGQSSRVKGIVAYLSTDNIADETGMLDIPSIIWERVPYSFVVDWWFGVGAYLQALHTSRSISGTNICTTDTTRYFSGPIGSGSVYDITTQNGGSYKSIRQVRTISNRLAVPPPSMKPLLHKDTAVRLTHTLESIALITQKGPSLRRAFLSLQGK